jgi:hypothetical protein
MPRSFADGTLRGAGNPNSEARNSKQIRINRSPTRLERSGGETARMLLQGAKWLEVPKILARLERSDGEAA